MKAVKVAVLAAPCGMLAAPHGVSATMCGMLAAPHGVLALQDTFGNSRGPEGPPRGDTIHENFYGLELLKNHFLTKKKVINDPR